MKKAILQIIVLLVITLNLSAEKTQVEIYQIPIDQKERIILENEIGKAEILNPELIEQLENCRIGSITYVHSSYAPNGFDQKALDNARREKLAEHIHVCGVKWNEVAQKACAKADCAKNLLHGFVIEFVPKSTFHFGRIEKQTFTCNSQKRSTFKGKHGTVLKVKPHSFTYEDGTPVKGDVQLELREALDFENIVKGNLRTTTSNGELLQTGGMIQIQAFSNGKNLQLQKGKSIQIGIPATEKKNDMQLYTGIFSEGEIEWADPVDLTLEKESDQQRNRFLGGITWSGYHLGQGINEYTVINWYADNVKPNEKGNKIQECTVKPNGEGNEVSIKIEGSIRKFLPHTYTIELGELYGLDKRQAARVFEWVKADVIVHRDTICNVLNPANGNFSDRRSNERNDLNGNNVNYEMNYLFSQKKLGWANIDRLAKFPNTYDGKLEVKLRNFNEKAIASIALVVPSADVFIPGYKMKKGNYAFTHGDFEQKVPLPKNETAYIIATFNEEGKDYFGTKKIRIGSNEVISLSMLEKEKAIALKEIERLF